MKSIIQIRNLLTRSTLLLALAGLAWLPAAGFAQEKGATKLMQLKPIQTTADLKAVEPDDTVVMSCPKCKDSWATVVEKTGKAVQPEIKHQVLRHECPGCANTIVTEGHGKAKTDKVVHVCKQCGSKDAFCCVMKKGAGPTPGMDEHKNHNH
jgi:predicted RNA-binding Zn-ribbon protein involved in translation (DUF1610 family)